MPALTAREALIDALRDIDLFGSEGACPTLFDDGPLDRVLVITGENAGGKSLFCRYLSQLPEQTEIMRIGMGKRTQGGIERGFMFGEEDRESTGRISGNVITTGISTAHNRTKPHWLMLDEPDIGLGEGYQRAAGEVLARFASSLPEMTHALVVVSHSRPLIRELLDAGAMSIRVGDDLRPVRQWIAEGDLPMTVEDFEALPEKAHKRMRAIQEIQNERRREMATAAPRR